LCSKILSSEADANEYFSGHQLLQQFKEFQNVKSTSRTLKVNWKDIHNTDDELARLIRTQYYRFESSLRKSVQQASNVYVNHKRQSMFAEATQQEEEDFWIGFHGLPEALKYVFTWKKLVLH